MLSSLLAVMSCLGQNPPAGPRLNHAPIVLVAGFTGWGRDQLLGLKYWGGPGRDLEQELQALGYPTCSPAVGPLSSNWDRSAELFASLKGGVVDYGQAHAARHGHARFGRRYPGLLPHWGQPDLPKVHLIGHSMGGQTIRVLTQLLAKGDAGERQATPADQLSPLFQGGHPWVLSLTSLATPHNGTTLTRRREGLARTARRALAMTTGLTGSHASLYDLSLEHWNLARRPGETLSACRKRIQSSPLWLGTEDFSAWDLSLEGAQALNQWVHLPAEVYGFSWSTGKTQADRHGYQVPAPGMNPLWQAGARFMGRPGADEQHPAVDPSWYPNDGVVNTRSMAGPSGDPGQPFDGQPRRGRWNHLGLLAGWDHSEILGMGPQHRDQVPDFYRGLARFLGSLEP